MFHSPFCPLHNSCACLSTIVGCKHAAHTAGRLLRKRRQLLLLLVLLLLLACLIHLVVMLMRYVLWRHVQLREGTCTCESHDEAGLTGCNGEMLPSSLWRKWWYHSVWQGEMLLLMLQV